MNHNANLPDGCRVSDLPGWRKEDEAMTHAEECAERELEHSPKFWLHEFFLDEYNVELEFKDDEAARRFLDDVLNGNELAQEIFEYVAEQYK